METGNLDIPEILIVEDDEDLGLALSDRFKSLGYHVRVARTGPEAIAIAVDHNHHAVILDLNLADMDGLQVLRSLKEIDPTLLAVVLISEPDTTLKKEVSALGAFECLVKPYNSHELDAFISWAIKVKPLLQSRQRDSSVA